MLETPNKETIKISLKAARINAGFTLEEASVLVGVCKSTLIKWEKRPDLINVKWQKTLAGIFNLPVECIFFGLK